MLAELDESLPQEPRQALEARLEAVARCTPVTRLLVRDLRR